MGYFILHDKKAIVNLQESSDNSEGLGTSNNKDFCCVGFRCVLITVQNVIIISSREEEEFFE